MSPNNDEEDNERQAKQNDIPAFWNIIFIQGEINDNLALHVSERLLTADFINASLEQPEPITIIINSPGGSVTAAWQMCDMMDYVNSEIHTVGLGKICSAGLLLFMNGTKGHRKVSDRCAIMSHRYSWGAEGKHTDLIAVRKEQDYVHQRILRHYMECTGLSKKYIEKNLLLEHDTWLTPEEGMKHKMVDGIISIKKSKNFRKKNKVKLKEE
jgi:ATP-dependent Clp protease protease subunit